MQNHTEASETRGLPKWRSLAEKLPPWQTIAMWVLVFSPAIVMALQIAEHAVNIPVWDDWERVELLKRYNAGELDLAYLLAPHIEHRVFFPRLAILALNEISGGDLRWEMALTFCVMLGYAVLLILLIRRTIGRPSWVFGLSFLINLLVFSPIQYQNFLWAVQLAFVLPLLGLVWCIWVMTHPTMSLPKKLAFSFAGAALATLSFGHGLFVWLVPLGLGILLYGFTRSLKWRWVFVGIWLLLSAEVCVWYFTWNFENVSAPSHAYGQGVGEKPPAIANLGTDTGDLGAKWKFFLGLLGNPLARTFVEWHEDSTVMLGWLIIIALLAGIIRWLWVFKDGEQRDSMLPWLALAGFGLAATMAIAVARSWLGIKGALIPRYATVALPVWIGLLGLWAGQLKRWREVYADGEHFAAEAARTRIVAVMATAFAMLQLPTWLYGLHQIQRWEDARLEARVGLLYIRHFPLTKILRLDATWKYVNDQAEYLHSQGLLDPPLIEEPEFGPFRRKKSSLTNRRAEVKVAHVSPDGFELEIVGHATLPKSGRCADGVIATVREGEGDSEKWRVLGVLEMEPLANLPAVRMDYQFTNRTILDRADDYGACNGSIPITQIPLGKRVSFWALDAKQMSAHRLKQAIRLTSAPEGGYELEIVDNK